MNYAEYEEEKIRRDIWSWEYEERYDEALDEFCQERGITKERMKKRWTYPAEYPTHDEVMERALEKLEEDVVRILKTKK